MKDSLIDQVKKAQVKNILDKLKSGKTISKSEQLMVAAFESGNAPEKTLEEVATHYGISRPGALKWKRAMKMLGLPFNSFEEIDKWREEKTKETKNPDNQTSAKLRKTLLEVERLEIQNAQIRGELMKRIEVREAGVAIGALLSAECSAMVNDLPGQIAGQDEVEIRPKLQSRIDLLLTNIRTKLNESAE